MFSAPGPPTQNGKAGVTVVTKMGLGCLILVPLRQVARERERKKERGFDQARSAGRVV